MPLLLLILVACGSRPAPRPNVMLITLDTTRADMIGAYGARDAATPTLDRLAAEGALFDRAYTVTPLTIPAHSSIMTGMLPPRHGVRDNGDFFLGSSARTVAEIMKENGYATMASVGAEVTSHHWGFAQGFDAFFDDMGPRDPTTRNRWRVERTADKVVADAEGWFGSLPEAQPWFAWVHLFDAHHPYEPPEPYATTFEGHSYQGEIAFVDSQVGALLDTLSAHNQLENTWIIVTGDHGEGLGSHGEQMHGVLLYDATTRIPLIMRPPTARAGRTVTTPVSLVDLVPTILTAADIPVPAGLDGIPLTDLVTGDAEGDATRTVYSESLYAYHHYGWAPQTALVTQEHKLIDSTTPEVYARGDDREATDLATADPALLARLQSQLGTLEAGLVPATGASEKAQMTADQTAQLEALGYLSGGAEPDLDPVGLPDPVRRLPSLMRLERARQAFQAGDLTGARAAAEEVVAAEPGLVETKMLLATILWRQGELDKAYQTASEVDQARPGSQPKAMMGTLNLQMRKMAEGIQLLSEALQIDPYLEGAWLAYLRALVITGDSARFQPEAARARNLLPDSTAIGGLYGIALAMQGRYDAAAPLLTAAIAADPNEPLLNHALGLTLRGQGHVTEAEAVLTEEVRMFPPALTTRRVLVEMYADQKRYEEQVEQLTAIAALEPPNALTLHSVAQALFNLKRYDAAYTEVLDCERVAPRYAPCVMLEANVLKKLGKEQEAQAAYTRAMAMAAP